MADDSQLEYDEEQPQADDETSQQPPAEETETHQPPAQRSESDLPIKEGVVFGAGAYLLSYVTFAAMMVGTVTQVATDTGEMPGSLTMAAWSMLSGLGVGLEAGDEAIMASNAVPGGSSSGVVMLLPFVAFIVAGYGLAKYVGATDTQSALKSAVMIVPGVLVLAIATALLATHTAGSGEEVTVSLVTSDAVLYAGIVFPAIFALIGGLLASWPDPVDQIMAKIDSQ